MGYSNQFLSDRANMASPKQRKVHGTRCARQINKILPVCCFSRGGVKQEFNSGIWPPNTPLRAAAFPAFGGQSSAFVLIASGGGSEFWSS